MSKKKFVTMGAVVGTLMLTQGVFAAGIAMTPSQNALSVQSGETVNKVDAVPAYMYQDSNYFMLRDIGRNVGYQVDWDEEVKENFSAPYSEVYRSDDNVLSCINVSDVQYDVNNIDQ